MRDRRQQPREYNLTIEYFGHWPSPLYLNGLSQAQINHAISALSDALEAGEMGERCRATVTTT
jgi:hypothetical protein